MTRTSIPNPMSALNARHRQSRPITVAFLGGSITWGGNSRDIETCSYRALLGEWFRQRYAGTAVHAINGGFGGTGSEAGVFRFETQILSHDPDLVFVEFAINDGTTPQSVIQGAHEAIFRKGWRHNPCMGFVLLISGSRRDTQAQCVSVKMAADFGLHVVDVGAAKRAMLQSGMAAMADLWTDQVHPGDQGHRVYFEQVRDCLEALADDAPRRVRRRTLDEAERYCRTVEYRDARLIPAAQLTAEGKGWRLTDTEHRQFDGVYPVRETWPDRTTWPFPYRHGLMRTECPGDALVYRGSFCRLGVALDYVAGDCEAEIWVDGAQRGVLNHALSDGRFPRVPVLPDVLEAGPHDVRIVLRRGRLNVGYLMVS